MNSKMGPAFLFFAAILIVLGGWKYFQTKQEVEPTEILASEREEALLDGGARTEPALDESAVLSTVSAGAAPAQTEELPSSQEVLSPPFRRLAVDPEKEKYIVGAKLGPAAKRILLAGMALHANSREISTSDHLKLRHELNEDLRHNRDEFRVDVRKLMEDEKAQSLEIREDVLHIATQMNPVQDSEMNQYAKKQFQEYVSRNQVFVGPDRDKLIDSMVVMAITDKNPKVGIEKIEQLIQADDPNQVAALSKVRAIIEFKTTIPPIPVEE